MVWPGVNQVVATPCLAISASSRSEATIPKSPREIIVGVVISRAIIGEALSKSNVRQTKCCAMGRLLGRVLNDGTKTTSRAQMQGRRSFRQADTPKFRVEGG